MKKKIILLFFSFLLLPSVGRSDIFGGDLTLLLQILNNSIRQLYELKQVVQKGKDTLDFMKDINKGINDSLNVIDSLGSRIDPGIYKELRKYSDIKRHLGEIYGIVAPSEEAEALKETDQVAVDAISLHNNMYDYAANLDKIGEEIKKFSHEVSPSGAQKLTAQSLGVLIHIQDQQLRATSTAIKLSAQSLLIRNKEKKEESAQYLKQAQILKSKMQSSNINFEFPRF